MKFISLLFLLIISSLAEEKIVFLLTLFRHGARSPGEYLNKSLHLDYIFEKWDNLGELTPTGRRMHYALGLRNREIYINKKHFLSEKFDPFEILVYSTNYNRTLESVASQLQGLYPFNTGEEITEEQKSKSLPPSKISEKIKSELDKMNNNALPFKMSLIPIRMINDKELKINVANGCYKRAAEILSNNSKNAETKLINIYQKFYEAFGQELIKIYGKEILTNNNFISNFCDAFIAGIAENKKMEKINEVKIDKEKLLNSCFEFNSAIYKDIMIGDKERSLAILEVSKLLKEFIYYMKQRIDYDINKGDAQKKVENYSKLKMIMISAHDTTLSLWEMFFIKVFLKNDDTKYIFPKFAAQLTLEVVTDNKTDSSKKKNYNNYTINCFFNDDLFFSRKVDEFINIVESNIYDDDKLNEICLEKSNTSGEEKEKKKKNNYFHLMIVFVILTGILIILLIFFIIKANINKSSDINNMNDLLVLN